MFQDIPFVVWLNEYEKSFAIKVNDKVFEESKIYREFSSQFATVIHVPPYGFFAEDAGRAFATGLSFDEILKRGVFKLVNAQGLCCYRSRFWEVLDKASVDIEAYRANHQTELQP